MRFCFRGKSGKSVLTKTPPAPFQPPQNLSDPVPNPVGYVMQPLQIRYATPTDTFRTTPDTLYNPNGYVAQPRRIRSEPRATTSEPLRPGSEPRRIRYTTTPDTLCNPNGYVVQPRRIRSEPRPTTPIGGSNHLGGALNHLGRCSRPPLQVFRTTLEAQPTTPIGALNHLGRCFRPPLQVFRTTLESNCDSCSSNSRSNSLYCSYRRRETLAENMLA